MRSDTPSFAVRNEAPAKRPRFVIRIEFDVESIYMTSHPNITGVPGVVMQNVLRVPSAVSQRIVPDEGRSEIGSFTFSLVDLKNIFTDEVRAKLQDEGKGLRGKQVRFYVGYGRYAPPASGGFGTGGFGATPFGEGLPSETIDAVFSQFQLFQTQIITDISFQSGVYEVQCADITREQRSDIFDPKLTTLRDSVSATDTTIPVYQTTGFQPVWHGSSYSDAPNQTVGYIKVEDEWIRYPFEGVRSDSFVGCTRGVMNTRAVAHTVDPGTEADRRPKVEEGIYLEMPAPKLAYAILTGAIYGTSPRQTLPPHWHAGIKRNLVRLSDFTDIGADLWDTSFDTEGFVVRFQGLKKTTGKKFLESELYMLLGCYSPIYADGTIGLKRMNPVLADAAYVIELNPMNVVSHGALQHDLSGMHNRLQIDWNWNGDRFTRSTLFIDAESIKTHGSSPLKTLQFKGLHGSRHTEGIIRKRLDAFRDRYTSPPELLTVTVLPSLNKMEIGDIPRMKMPHIRDFAGQGPGINRSFEIQRRSVDYISGNVTFELFGSTAPASIESPTQAAGYSLTDAFYESEGINLSTVVTIVLVGAVGVIQPGSYNLTAGIYYYLGDLELANGATLTINGTVQIRTRGFFTVNGAIDGIGRGKPGQVDTDVSSRFRPIDTFVLGLPGFIGNSRGMDGVTFTDSVPKVIFTVPVYSTVGQYATFPFLDLTVSGNSLLGVPADLAGTSGGGGGKVGLYSVQNENSTVISLGGTGANSGAGLVFISRGIAFGASGSVNLSGNDAAATSIVQVKSKQAYPGAGGAGSPGGFLLLLDGSSQSIPDLGGKFIAHCGTVPISGSPIPWIAAGGTTAETAQYPIAGYQDPALISNVDLSNVAYRVQYLPAQEVAQEDAGPSAPTDFSITFSVNTNVLRWTPPPELTYDTVEVYASSTNDRTDALLVDRVRGSTLSHTSVNVGLLYYWIRARDSQGRFSPWAPEGEDEGLSSVSRPYEYHPIPDPRFSYATDQSYWKWGAYSGISIVSAGGVSDGVMRIVGDGTQKGAYSNRTPMYSVTTGQKFSVHLRYRRTSALVFSGADDFALVCYSMFSLANAPPSPYAATSFAVTDVGGATVNEWQETDWVATIVNNAKNQQQLPYVTFGIEFSSSFEAGTIEIDSLIAIPI